MSQAGIKSQMGCRKLRYSFGKIANIAVNALQQNFSVSEPNKVCETDITYIRTYENRLYLTVVIDLFSRIVVGWSTQSTMHSEIILNALSVDFLIQTVIKSTHTKVASIPVLR